MSGPLSDQIIRDMSMDERIDRLDEIKRWMGAGSPEGQPAPLGPHVRPDGHQFTHAELKWMEPEDIVLNRAAILAQVGPDGSLQTGGV